MATQGPFDDGMVFTAQVHGIYKHYEWPTPLNLAFLVKFYTEMTWKIKIYRVFFFNLGDNLEWLDGMTGCQGECDLSSTWVTYSNFEWGPNWWINSKLLLLWLTTKLLLRLSLKYIVIWSCFLKFYSNYHSLNNCVIGIVLF